MVSKVVSDCEEIMRQLVKSGFTNQVSKNSLELAIMSVRGADPRTLKNWTKNLIRLEYLKRLNASVFQMNLVKVNGLVEMVVRERGQRKLL